VRRRTATRRRCRSARWTAGPPAPSSSSTVARAPLRHRPGIDARFPTQRRERRLRPLYRCSAGGRARGARVTCPIGRPSIPAKGSHRQTGGSNSSKVIPKHAVGACLVRRTDRKAGEVLRQSWTGRASGGHRGKYPMKCARFRDMLKINAEPARASRDGYYCSASRVFFFLERAWADNFAGPPSVAIQS